MIYVCFVVDPASIAIPVTVTIVVLVVIAIVIFLINKKYCQQSTSQLLGDKSLAITVTCK